MPDEHIPEEPLDEEERQLMRELEAGEWVSDPDFVRPNFAVTDTFVEAVSALEVSSDELARVLKDSYRWKWAILALHSALQGMMALTLRGGNNLRVLKPQDAKRWLDAYESGAPLPANLQMDDFLNLYKKIKSDTILFYETSKKFTPEGTQGKSIKDLNRLRNQFVHFTPCTFALILNGLPEMTIDCLKIAWFLAHDSGNIDWPEELVGRMEKAFRAAAKAAQEIKEAYALPPQV